MAASTRTVTQASEIVQDTMPADSSYDTDGEILSDSIAPFTLRKAFRWVVGLSKSVIGEAGRRKGSTRIQGTPVVLTGKITSSGTTVTGASSLFLSELEDGSWIAGPLGEYREVLSRASDTSLTLVQAFSVDIASSSNFTRLPTLSERVSVIERHINYLINGDFDLWQRGVSFATPANLAYTADRHQVEYDGSIGAFDVTREAFSIGQTDVPDEPRYFFRWDQTGAGSAQTLKRLNYKIESVRSLAGKTIQVKFYGKVGASTQAIGVGAVQNFGTGGSPSSAVTVTAKSRTLTTSWQVFNVELVIPSISGKTVGNDGNDYLNVFIDLPLNVTFTADFSHRQIYEGTSNREFVHAGGSVITETNMCNRFYQKSYNREDDPGTITTDGALGFFTKAAGVAYTCVQLMGEMRAMPTFTPYSTNTGAAGFSYNTLTPADNAASILSSGTKNITLSISASLGDANSLVQYTADAELP